MLGRPVARPRRRIDRNRHINHSRPSKKPISGACCAWFQLNMVNYSVLHLQLTVLLKVGSRRLSYTYAINVHNHGAQLPYPLNELYVLLLHQLLIVIVNGSLIFSNRAPRAAVASADAAAIAADVAAVAPVATVSLSVCACVCLRVLLRSLHSVLTRISFSFSLLATHYHAARRFSRVRFTLFHVSPFHACVPRSTCALIPCQSR